MSLPHINYGDTLLVACVCKDSTGTPVPIMNGLSVTATITAPDGMSVVPQSVIVVTLANQSTSPGAFTISSDTAQWDNTIGTWSLLIRYTDSNGIKTSADRVEFDLC